jgi:hypothetical protein
MGRRLALLGAVIAGLLALLTKETSIVVLPISLAWLVLERLIGRKQGKTWRWNARQGLVAASLVGLPLIALIVRSQLVASAGMEVHTSVYRFSASGFLSSAIRIAGWLLRDFPYLIPLGLVLVILGLRVRVARPPLLLEGLVWIAAWTGVFLPWPFIAEYYLLPAAAGAALASGAAIDAVWANRVALGAGSRWAIVVLLVLAAAGFLTTAPNSLTSARIQPAVDSANAEALQGIAERLPRGARLIVNLQEPREYYDMIRIFLTQRLGRPDLQIEALDPATFPPASAGRAQTYVLTPIVAGTPYFTVRVGVGEDDAQAWNELLRQRAGDDLVLVERTRREFRRGNVDLPAAVCPILRRSVFCATSRPVVYTGVFTFGWDLYAMSPP